ncbi:MAG: molecular chaperone TorD [Rhodobacterales bacterium]|nr:molecular chaperone TorD [Rhodobacterales bacterium]
MTHIAPLADARVRAYRWLAGLFARELTAREIGGYRAVQGQALLMDLARSTPALAGGVEALRAALRAETPDTELALDLAGDYARLFLGVARRQAAPPFASAYLSERGLLFQEATRRMENVLRYHDLSIPDDFKEPADHIAVELTVMAELAGRGAVTDNPAARRLRAEQADFLDIHLLTWLPDFARDCAQFDSRGVYGALATATHDFITDDRTRLAA